MTKNIKQIQEENRKLILEAIYGKSLKEYDESEIRKEPLTLSKVLIALNKLEDGDGFKLTSFGRMEWAGTYQFTWYLTKETLESQSEETQRVIFKLLEGKKDD